MECVNNPFNRSESLYVEARKKKKKTRKIDRLTPSLLVPKKNIFIENALIAKCQSQQKDDGNL